MGVQCFYQSLGGSYEKEITEEQAVVLSNVISNLKKGEIVCITYYYQFGYVEKTGAVTQIDIVNRKLRIVKTYIPFDDIYQIIPIIEEQI